MRRSAAWIVCCLALAPPFLRGQAVEQAQTSGVLHELHGTGELQAAFDQDHDKIRLVLLLSPT